MWGNSSKRSVLAVVVGCAVVDLVMKSLSAVNETSIASTIAFGPYTPVARLRCCLCYTVAQVALLDYSLGRHCVVCGKENVCAAVLRHIRPRHCVVVWEREMVCRPLLNVE